MTYIHTDQDNLRRSDMKDVLKNDNIRREIGDELYGKFSAFVAALRAEIDPADFDCETAEDVLCFSDEYCMVGTWKDGAGNMVLHFNERAGGNYCGEYVLDARTGIWTDCEGEQSWHPTLGFIA